MTDPTGISLKGLSGRELRLKVETTETFFHKQQLGQTQVPLGILMSLYGNLPHPGQAP